MENKNKILIAADIFPPVSGGPATYCVNIANELFASDVLLGVVSLTPNSDQTKIKGSLYSVTSYNKIIKYFQYLYLLFKYSKQSDVVYAMGPVNSGLPAWLVATILGKKFVLKIVGDYAWEQGVARFGIQDLMDDFQYKNDYSLSVKILKLIEKFVAKKADCVIAPSEYLKRIVVGWGCNPEKINVVYNAVNFKEVGHGKKEVGERWLVSVARLMPWKGMDVLIKIMPGLIKKFPNLRLKIVGDGPEKNKLEGIIKDLRLENSVDLLGNLSREKTLSYIHAADIFILNSGYEGLSHVILEAMSLGRFVLASDAGGNSEIVLAGFGELFPYNNSDKIKHAIEDCLKKSIVVSTTPEVRMNFFKKFEYKTMVEQTKEILLTV